MTSTIDTGILELMASKVCHDLISPIGAINNGMEFLEDAGPSAGKEVIDLINFSAQQASAKLQAFRMAYGAGGADPNIKPEDVHKTIQQIVGAEKKITQDWNPHADLGSASKEPGFCKILVCALLLAMECLPKGGKISVAARGDGKVIIRAEGVNANLRDKAAAALALKTGSGDLEPKDVHSYISAIMAKHYGFNLTPAPGGDNFTEFAIGFSA